MNQTTWLTNGDKSFEVPVGSPLEKKLLSEGYEECSQALPEAPATTLPDEPSPTEKVKNK